ncbi:hypothetical protein [Streptomyces sp. NPDC101237]|uniref:hypothetical protein n=1 Tax=Streptomyces sp. NPDC101237 TaxID=3366139 RepID=UPI00382683CA
MPPEPHPAFSNYPGRYVEYLRGRDAARTPADEEPEPYDVNAEKDGEHSSTVQSADLYGEESGWITF